MVVPELAQNVTFEVKMASNTAAPFGIELRHVEHLQGSASASLKVVDAQVATQPAPSPAVPSTSFSAAPDVPELLRETPFAALSARHGRPLKIAILSDFTRIPYANGAAFQTRFLYQELRRCGHQVTVIGPFDPDARPDELAPGTVSLPSVPLKSYPGLHVPLPLEAWVFDASRWDFDIIFGQTTSLLMEFGVWLRKMRGIPMLCVNTTHLVAAYDVLLPERVTKLGWVNAALEFTLKRPFEKIFANMYNNSDGLVVLSEGLRSYWRERGVTAPIHVIPRAVVPAIFDKPIGEDPYTHLEQKDGNSWRGARLLCAGRHTREKSQDRIIRIFARHIAQIDREATLTLLGEGPDSKLYKRIAMEEGVADRVYFPCEVPFTKMPDYYAYSDVFVHGSVSETYGNVMGEALWCGTPTVAFADGMGVSSQIKDRVNGVLLAPGKGEAAEADADAAFGKAVLELLAKPEERAKLGKAATRIARERSSPIAVQTRLADAFHHAQEHAAACGLRPAVDGPRLLQWLTTLTHFRTWFLVNGGVSLVGKIRQPHTDQKVRAAHPQIAT